MTFRRSAAQGALGLALLALASCASDVAASRITIPPDPYAAGVVAPSVPHPTTTAASAGITTKKKSAFGIAGAAGPTTTASPGTLDAGATGEVAAAATGIDPTADQTPDTVGDPSTSDPAAGPPASDATSGSPGTTLAPVDPSIVTQITAEPAPPGSALGPSLVAICDTAPESSLLVACTAEITLRDVPPSLDQLSCFVRIYRLEHADLVDDWTIRLDAPAYQRVLSDIRTSCGLG